MGRKLLVRVAADVPGVDEWADHGEVRPGNRFDFGIRQVNPPGRHFRHQGALGVAEARPEAEGRSFEVIDGVVVGG